MTSKVFSYKAPSSKSIANRALILAALSQGTSKLQNVPYGDDVDLMIHNLRLLGVHIKETRGRDDRTLLVTGTNNKIDQSEHLSRKTIKLNTGYAGTTTRFLLAFSTLLNKKIILSGSDRMQQRPIKDLIDALRSLSANITYNTKVGHLPVTIHPQIPVGGSITIDASKTSQFVSSLLLIAPFLERKTTFRIQGLGPSQNYIESTRTLIHEWEQKGKNPTYSIPSDIASASYIIAIAILSCTKIVFENYTPSRLHPERKFFETLEKMGCKLKVQQGILEITPPVNRKSLGTIDASTMPDTALTLAMIAALTPGKTTLKNIQHLKYKECDRLTALHKELTKLGIQVKKTSESLTVWGKTKPLPKKSIHTYGDHRIALAFSILKSQYPQIIIQNPDVVQKSYPNYWRDYREFALSLNKNIVLIGMPGTGKTSFGKALAKYWKYDFIDLDEVFESRMHTKINAYIEIHGWEAFRKKESELLRSLKPNSRTVIATGGGVVLKKDNIPLLENLGTIVCLKTTYKNLLSHLKKDPKTTAQRPHLSNTQSMARVLKNLYRERTPLYDTASQITISPISETSDSQKDLARKIQSLEQELFSNAP